MKWILFSLWIGLCLGFLGCEKQEHQAIQDSIEQKQEILENLVLKSNDDTELIVNQKLPKIKVTLKTLNQKKKIFLKISSLLLTMKISKFYYFSRLGATLAKAFCLI